MMAFFAAALLLINVFFSIAIVFSPNCYFESNLSGLFTRATRT